MKFERSNYVQMELYWYHQNAFNKSYKMVNLHYEKKKTLFNSYESLKEQNKSYQITFNHLECKLKSLIWFWIVFDEDYKIVVLNVQNEWNV
jgi:hypothetical protein